MTPSFTVALLVAILQTIAGALFIFFAATGTPRVRSAAIGSLAIAAGLQTIDVVLERRFGEATISASLEIASAVLSIAVCLFATRERLAALGAFAAPVILLLHFVAWTTHPQRSDAVQLPVTLRMHILVSTIGIVCFVLAGVVAATYVVQERLVRAKQTGGLVRRLPPLDRLDRLDVWLVATGLPLLTLGIGSGLLVVSAPAALFEGSRIAAILAWAVFATTLALRIIVGLRGRRAAVGTLIGFACAIVLLGGYVARDPGALDHARRHGESPP